MLVIFSKLMHKIMLNFDSPYLCNQALNQKMGNQSPSNSRFITFDLQSEAKRLNASVLVYLRTLELLSAETAITPQKF
jgi:hypothetical protein